MRPVPAVENANPLIDLNTTPLIDVMLVLLVMFIITIPIQTHAVKIDLRSRCALTPVRGEFENFVHPRRYQLPSFPDAALVEHGASKAWL